ESVGPPLASSVWRGDASDSRTHSPVHSGAHSLGSPARDAALAARARRRVDADCPRSGASDHRSIVRFSAPRSRAARVLGAGPGDEGLPVRAPVRGARRARGRARRVLRADALHRHQSHLLGSRRQRAQPRRGLPDPAEEGRLMPLVVYFLCSVTALLCAILVMRAYLKERVGLLMWTGLCFLGLSLNNALLFVDMLYALDIGTARKIPAVVGVGLLLHGLIAASR